MAIGEPPIPVYSEMIYEDTDSWKLIEKKKYLKYFTDMNIIQSLLDMQFREDKKK